MPRYYFDILTGDGLSRDQEGIELPDLGAAHREVARAVGEMARDELRAAAEVGMGLNMTVEVRTDASLVIRATFSFDVERLQ